MIQLLQLHWKLEVSAGFVFKILYLANSKSQLDTASTPVVVTSLN